MKKSLFFLIMLFSVAVKASGCYYYIYMKSSDTVYAGDSAWVGMYFYSPAAPDTMKMYVRTSSSDSVLVFKKKFLDIFKKPIAKVYNPLHGDSCYKITYKAPEITSGKYMFSDCEKLVSVFFTTRPVGIEEYSPAPMSGRMEYFSVLGQSMGSDRKALPEGLVIERICRGDQMQIRKLYITK